MTSAPAYPNEPPLDPRHVNRVTLVGTIARMPEWRTKQDGCKVLIMILRTTRPWLTDPSRVRFQTHRVVVFSDIHQDAIHEAGVGVGDRIRVEGELQHRRVAEAPQEKWVTEIVVHQDADGFALPFKTQETAQ